MRSPSESAGAARSMRALMGSVVVVVVKRIALEFGALWLRAYMAAGRDACPAARYQGESGSSGIVREGGGTGLESANLEGLRNGRAFDAAAAAAFRRLYESSMGVDGPQSSVGVVMTGMGTSAGAKWTCGSGGTGCVGGGKGLDKCLVRARSGARGR
jgi:hypothetical protein